MLLTEDANEFTSLWKMTPDQRRSTELNSSIPLHDLVFVVTLASMVAFRVLFVPLFLQVNQVPIACSHH